MMEILLYLLLAVVFLIAAMVFSLRAKLFKQSASYDLDSIFNQLKTDLEKLERKMREEFSLNRDEVAKNSKLAREELNNSFKLFNDQNQNGQKDFADQLAKLTKLNDEKMESIRTTVDKKLDSIQLGNEKKLEEMRVTVDEKLHSTLEKRLGDSFKIVSERLELVHKGLGEMQNLATGVGDLKKVLTNVKARGTWGEIQLGNAIEQILSPEQYLKNVSTKKGSNDKVEFAIKMPGRNDSIDEMTLLPIDAKFPIEDYQRMIDASERGDILLIEEAGKALENRIKLEAKTIHEKYIDPPHTTDVAILFLPVEGLFAEVLRRPGLFEKIQNDFKVTIAGPTTLIAILNSLQMGFRTLAIEKRSSEVWNILSMVKNEFSKFGALLENTQKKLETASKSIEEAARKSRTIEKKLNKVQQLPEAVESQPKFIDNE